MGGFKASHWHLHSLFAASNMTSKGKKALGQSRLLRADWIAKSLLAAAPRMPQLTLKLHAEPGLCLHDNHQQQIPWTNPALPPGKPLPPVNPTSLATRTEQRRNHPQRHHRHRKRFGRFRPNPCLEPPALDRTRLPSALLFEDRHLLTVNKPGGLQRGRVHHSSHRIRSAFPANCEVAEGCGINLSFVRAADLRRLFVNATPSGSTCSLQLAHL
jgi:hypothetical protein